MSGSFSFGLLITILILLKSKGAFLPPVVAGAFGSFPTISLTRSAWLFVTFSPVERSLFTLILSVDFRRICSGLFIDFSNLGRVDSLLFVSRPSYDLTLMSEITLSRLGFFVIVIASLSSWDPELGARGDAVSSFLIEGS